MKRLISIVLCVVMLLCVFSFVLPSFALSYEDFTYEIVNENVVITGYNGANAEIIIPTEINDKFVVKIGDNAFKDNDTLKSVTISEGIKDVGAGAFENCVNLATISLPTTIIHMGKNAIYNTAYYNNTANWKLKTINTDNGMDIGGSIPNDTLLWEEVLSPTLEYLYLGTVLIECESNGTYKIKQGTTVIADYAFAKSTDMISVVFPTSLATIGDYAFSGCQSIKDFNIAENVAFSATSIYNTGFYNNPKNWEDNALYIDTRLVATKCSEVVVKDGTTHIISGAISSENVVIPASVTSIHKNAFTITNATIYGYADTYAQAYAKENSINFVNLDTNIKGDVNFNGQLDSDDYKILCDIAVLKETPSHMLTLIGDMNEDGIIDGYDVIILDLFINDIGPSTIKGDADSNGKVNEDDYALLVKIATHNEKISDNYMFDRCDLNDDGAVDSFDALYLDLALNGLVAIL